jgi:hypothetical protein
MARFIRHPSLSDRATAVKPDRRFASLLAILAHPNRT